jgi:hypothetical protein
MGRMSNRDRIARAAEEARLTAAEKADKADKTADKKATKKPAASRPKRTVVPVRMKIIWEVCGVTGTALKAFPYPDKAKAEAEIAALTKSTGRPHSLRATKVPME